MSKEAPVVKPPDEILKPPVADSKAEQPKIEEWWTRTSPMHRIAIKQRDDKGQVVLDDKKRVVGTYVKFDRSRIECDLSKQSDRNISAGLHESGREGVDIFVIGQNYKGTELGDNAVIAFSKMLRELASDETGLGIDKIMGLFSMKELREMGVNINRPKNDVDTLIHFALKNKTLAQLK